MEQIGKARRYPWFSDRLANRLFGKGKSESVIIEAERRFRCGELHWSRQGLAAGMRRWHSVGTTLPAHFTAASLFFRGSGLRHTRHERP